MMSALGFKARVDPFQGSIPLDGQHGSRAFLIHILTDHVSTSIDGGLNPRLTERATAQH